MTAYKANLLLKFRREKLGFIFQGFNLLDTLTAFENIALALTIHPFLRSVGIQSELGIFNSETEAVLRQIHPDISDIFPGMKEAFQAYLTIAKTSLANFGARPCIPDISAVQAETAGRLPRPRSKPHKHRFQGGQPRPIA